MPGLPFCGTITIMMLKLTIETVLGIDKKPRVLVGVLGASGQGKSSLLNAMLGYESMLPSNGMRACSASAVEVAYNPSNDPKKAYYAVVEFLSSQEWADYVKFLQGEIKTHPEGEQIGQVSSSEASAAWDKISAVYPGIKAEDITRMTSDEVLSRRDLSNILGQAQEICDAKAPQFSVALNKFLDAQNRGQEANSLILASRQMRQNLSQSTSFGTWLGTCGSTWLWRLKHRQD